MFRNLRYRFALFMQGRYGTDQLSRFLSVVVIILLAAEWIANHFLAFPGLLFRSAFFVYFAFLFPSVFQFSKTLIAVIVFQILLRLFVRCAFSKTILHVLLHGLLIRSFVRSPQKTFLVYLYVPVFSDALTAPVPSPRHDLQLQIRRKQNAERCNRF